MKYTAEKLKGMRGYNALTQGEENAVRLLVHNVNETNKVKGFIITKSDLLKSQFDKEAVGVLLELSLAIHNRRIVYEEYVGGIAKVNLEKIFRDHVPLDGVKTFLDALTIIYEDTMDMNMTIEIIQNYATQEIKTMGRIYADFLEVVERKKIGGTPLCNYL